MICGPDSSEVNGDNTYKLCARPRIAFNNYLLYGCMNNVSNGADTESAFDETLPSCFIFLGRNPGPESACFFLD